MTTDLFALSLQQSITLALTDYQKQLFSAAGDISSIALPPLVPLAWAGREDASLEGSLSLPEGSIQLSGEIQISEGDCSYAMLKDPSAIRKLQESLGKRFSGRSLFPLQPGIFLLAQSCSVSLPQIPASACAENTDLRLVRLRLLCSDTRPWWEDILISYVRDIHLRSGRVL